MNGNINSSITDKFYGWANYLHIVSKERGFMRFSRDKWYRGQKLVVDTILDEIAKSSPVRQFIILKARQLGITTVLHALDLYWTMAIPGISLGFLCQSYEVRPKLRKMLRLFYLVLPQSMKRRITIDNRELMHFSNGSNIQFLHVSSREAGRQTAARSQALTCLHATEAAFYSANDPNDEVLKSLLISLSQKHPARYCIIESTANGFNSFYDRWMEAKKNPTQKAIFVGWYMKDDYRIDPTSPIYPEYSYPPTKDERLRIKLIDKEYGIRITMSQLAWFRKELATTFAGDLHYCLQELPWHEDEAFRLSGYKFFNVERLTRLANEVRQYTPIYFDIYADNRGVYINPANKGSHNLKIFEFPQENENYFIGADPSYASSPDSDNAVISVWKGYKDKVVQVAEYSDNSVGIIEFAKLCIFFACFYKDAFISIEVQGPGRMVLKELDNLRVNNFDIGDIIWNSDVDTDQIKANITRIREYLYYRADALRRSYARHWQTTPDTKPALMGQFKSLFEMDLLEIKSQDLFEEMNFFVKDGTRLGAEAGRNDDRVIAAAIAVEAWRRYAYFRLPSEKESSKKVTKDQYQVLKNLGVYDVIRPFLDRPGGQTNIGH